MKTDKKELNKHQVEITVRVNQTDAQPMLDEAARHLSERRSIKGFRPGKATFEVVKRELGFGPILEEAMEEIINQTFNSVLEAENINTYGKVNFDLLPIASPDEVAAYKATVTIMPKVTLGDWQSKKIKRQPVSVSDAELNQALDELAGMTVSEAQTDEAAALTDKAVVDFEVVVDGKVIEGGSAKDFALVLGEGRMIPGFEEKIIGHKAGENVEFKLSFPKTYQAAHLAGKEADFKITVKQILKRIKPTIDDGFAQRVGVADLNDLKSKLQANIQKEKQNKEEERSEIAAIKQIVDTSKFDEFPDAMITDTVDELLHDFEHSLAHQNVKMDQYLASVGKTVEQTKKEFEPKAVERIKSSIALGKIAELEKLSLTTQVIGEELERQRKTHANNPEAMNDLARPEYRRHIANTLMNRKIIQFITDKIVE